MNKEQAKEEYLKIIREVNRKSDEIIAEAKKNGTWRMGLDSNNDLFKEIDDEAKKKIKDLLSHITE